MRTHLRPRSNPLWRYALPVVTAAAVVASTMPAQAFTDSTTTPEDMDYPAAEAPTSLRDQPQGLALAQDAGQALNYLVASLAANPEIEPAAGTVGADIREGLRALPADRQALATRNAQAMVTADAGTRAAEFGRHSRVEPREYARLGFEGAFTAATIPVDWNELGRSLRAQAAQVEAESAVAGQHALDVAAAEGVDTTAATALVKSVRLRVTSVKAVEETSDWGTDDEIAMGGVNVNHKGVAKKVDEFMVSSSFDTGDIVVFPAPGLTFAHHDVTGTDPSAPLSFVSKVMLADKDSSGFAKAIGAAWEKIKGIVTKAIEQGVGFVLPQSVAKVIITLIGKLVAWLVDVFLKWLVKLFGDEVLTPSVVSKTIPYRYKHMFDNNKLPGWDNLRTPKQSLWFYGDGGCYRVNVFWELQA
ncbi:hypothetical protein [Saccharothrix xinjiangensis]|uniref:Secreted protein n=1 Tax=Saccharothrix xinjiangensis TaxID=204798 RepID=A0ABV9XRP4_9PSEU